VAASGVKALLELARQHVEAIGLAGVAGLGLLVFAAAFALTALAPAYEALETARFKRERALARLAAQSSDPAGKPESVADQLARFLGHFPSPDNARQALLQLHVIAARHGVQLRSAEYRVAADPGSGLLRHQVAVPVKGSYTSLRAFVADALEQLPSLALEAAAFKRDAVGVRDVEGRLQFTLYSSAS
jgi:hypothetical protein